MERRLRVSRDMRDDALEDLGEIRRRRPELRIQVLELNLLAPEVISESSKVACAILFAFLMVKAVVLDSLPDLGGVLVGWCSHGGDFFPRRGL
jgi:hypothetical protein